MNNRLIRNIKTDYLYCFIKNFDISSSIWVLYMVFKGLSLWQIGIVEGCYHLTGVLFEVPTGALADLLGRKKVIIAGRICSAISSILCLYGQNMWYFAFAFAISAIGQNLNSGSEEALVYDSLKQTGNEKDYLKVRSRLNIIIEVAQGMAIVIGGIIAEYSFPVCYVLSVIIAVISLIPAFIFTEPEAEQKRELTEEASDITESRPAPMKDRRIAAVILNHYKVCADILRSAPKLRKILIFYPMVFTFHTIMFFYGQEYFSSLGMNKIQISFIMLLAGIVSCLGAFCSERLLLRLGSGAKYVMSILMGLSIMAFSNENGAQAIIAFAAASFANAVLYPIQSQAINERIPSGQRATIISVDSMAFSIMMILLFPICGIAADYYDLSAVFLGLGALQLMLLGLISISDKQIIKKSKIK